MECSICMNDLHQGTTIRCCRCHTEFHNTCLIEWYSRNNSCPTCRHIHRECQHTEMMLSRHAQNEISCGIFCFFGTCIGILVAQHYILY